MVVVKRTKTSGESHGLLTPKSIGRLRLWEGGKGGYRKALGCDDVAGADALMRRQWGKEISLPHCRVVEARADERQNQQVRRQ